MSFELLGILLAILVPVTGWLWNRSQQRRTVAHLLALDAKFVRNWLDAVENGHAVQEYATLYFWRNNQALVANLFPRWCTERLASLWWDMESHDKVFVYGDKGMEAIRMDGLAAQAVFDWYAGQAVSVKRDEALETYIATAQVLNWQPPLAHRATRGIAVNIRRLPLWWGIAAAICVGVIGGAFIRVGDNPTLAERTTNSLPLMTEARAVSLLDASVANVEKPTTCDRVLFADETQSTHVDDLDFACERKGNRYAVDIRDGKIHEVVEYGAG